MLCKKLDRMENIPNDVREVNLKNMKCSEDKLK
jgi:hypothetical protein